MNELPMAVNSRYHNFSPVSYNRKNKLTQHNNKIIGIKIHAMRSAIYLVSSDTHSWPSHHAICFGTEWMLEIATA